VDAATRGLRTVLVEREDFGSGTSSKSTKLAHGGVRYLEKAVMNFDVAQLKLVWEALHERAHILTNAAHLSCAMPILTPCYKWWEVPYYWAGMKTYDAIAGLGNLAVSKYCGPTECLTRLPTLAQELGGRPLKGAILYYDGAFDDSRLNVTLAASAAAAGASVLNYVECKGLIKNAEGQVVGATCVDRLSGATFDVHARVVVNATGPFLDGVRRSADNNAALSVTASAGAHITLPAYYGDRATGLIIPKTKDGRVVFMLPFQGAVIAGTTDAPCPVTTRPRASDAEVAFILSTLSDYLGVRVPPSDVLSAWSGIRPLAHVPSANAAGSKQAVSGGGGGDTASIVRDHVIFTDPDGLLNVTGGKWTTYRRMAEDVVNDAVASGRLPLSTRPCLTSDLKLLGAQSYRPSLAAELAQHYRAGAGAGTQGGHARLSLDTATAEHLAHAYGDRAHMVLGIAERQGLGAPLVRGLPVMEAEVVHAVQCEYCVCVEDFVCRRTRLAYLDARATLGCLERVAQLMGDALGWSSAQRAAQVAAARRYIEATFFAGPPTHNHDSVPA